MKGLRVWYQLPQVRAVRVYEVCVVHGVWFACVCVWCSVLSVCVCEESKECGPEVQKE